MQQKSPDEIVCLQIHDFDLAVVAIILPMKLHPAVVDIDQAVVGDGHAMRISAHVVKHLLRSGERAFGVYHPFGFLCTGDPRSESVRIAKGLQRGKEMQLSRVECLLDALQKEAAKEARQHAHRKKESGAATNPALFIGRQSSARHDTVQVWMEHQILSPTMQDREEADLGTQMFGIGGDGL